MYIGTHRWSIVLGAALGLLVGAVTVEASEGNRAAADSCKAACECQSSCEQKLQVCNERCQDMSAEAQTKCIVDCNNALLGCVERCPDGDCNCGGY